MIKKGSLTNVRHLKDLRNKHACFAGVGTQAGWTIPLYNLVEQDVMPITDCNNYVKSTSDFFAESCAVNTLQDRYNPLGDNSNKLCEICGSHEPGVRCTVKDPYAGFRGAMLCLQDKGDIAFVKHNTLDSLASIGIRAEDHELLCKDGTRALLSDYVSCSWGVAPGHFVIVSSAMEPQERKAAQKFLTRAVKKYGRGGQQSRPGQFSFNDNVNFNVGEPTNTSANTIAGSSASSSSFDINESVGRYGNIPDLLFNDDLRRFDHIITMVFIVFMKPHSSLATIEDRDQLYKSVLEKSYGSSLITPAENINEIRRCPIQVEFFGHQ